MRRYVAWTGLALAAVSVVACGPARDPGDDGQDEASPEAAVERTRDSVANPRHGAAVADGIEDVRWRLLTLGGEAVAPPVEGREARFFALYSARQGLAGFAGCNRIAGSYELEGASVRFSEVVATRMACPDLPDEQRLLDALAATTGWRLGADRRLILTGADDAVLATFAADGPTRADESAG